MDDLRNHDAKPTAHEREWIDTDPRRAISRLFICGALAVTIGAASSTFLSFSASGGASSPASKLSSSR